MQQLPTAHSPWTGGRSRRHPLAIAVTTMAIVLAGCGKGPAGRGGPGSEPPVPVRVATVATREVPTTIEGIGNVTPITSVAVKSRVDGQIERVAVRDGAEVRRGDLLFQLDRRPFEVALQVARANLARDAAQLVKAQGQLKRYQDVYAKGYVSADQFADVKAAADAADATVSADRAAVDNARLNLEYATLRSPIDGRVGRVLIQQGNIVKAIDASPLLTINQMHPIYVEFAVPERFLAEVHAAAEVADATVELAAAGGGGETVVRSGRLSFVDNQVDQPTGTIRLRATLPNEDRALWPGQFTRVKIFLPSGGPVVAVPASAVGQSPQGAYVFVVTSDLKAEQRSISVARTDGDYAVVTSGVAPGERVVVDGQSRVIPGGKVSIVAAKAEKAPT